MGTTRASLVCACVHACTPTRRRRTDSSGIFNPPPLNCSNTVTSIPDVTIPSASPIPLSSLYLPAPPLPSPPPLPPTSRGAGSNPSAPALASASGAWSCGCSCGCGCGCGVHRAGEGGPAPADPSHSWRSSQVGMGVPGGEPPAVVDAAAPESGDGDGARWPVLWLTPSLRTAREWWGFIGACWWRGGRAARARVVGVVPNRSVLSSAAGAPGEACPRVSTPAQGGKGEQMRNVCHLLSRLANTRRSCSGPAPFPAPTARWPMPKFPLNPDPNSAAPPPSPLPHSPRTPIGHACIARVSIEKSRCNTHRDTHLNECVQSVSWKGEARGGGDTSLSIAQFRGE